MTFVLSHDQEGQKTARKQDAHPDTAEPDTEEASYHDSPKCDTEWTTDGPRLELRIGASSIAAGKEQSYHTHSEECPDE